VIAGGLVAIPRRHGVVSIAGQTTPGNQLLTANGTLARPVSTPGTNIIDTQSTIGSEIPADNNIKSLLQSPGTTVGFMFPKSIFMA
jgi:hypothetical protein